MPLFRFSALASPLHDPEAVARIVAPVAEVLRANGGAATDDPSHTDAPWVVVVATGGTEAAVLDLVARRAEAAPGEPVVLVTHPLHNSLPAALEALAGLRLRGHRGRIVPIDAPGEPATTIADLIAAQRIRHARLGLVGRPSEWLVASVPDRDAVRARWGIDLVDIPIDAPIAHHRAADPGASRAVAVKFSRRRPGLSAPGTPAAYDHDQADPEPADETLRAAAVHPALTAAIAEHHVNAITVRCFDFLGDLHTSGCVALAELNDTGVVAGCEGDVAAALAMMIARELLGTASWVANPATIDPATGRMVLAHCTVAPSLVEDLELHTHFESGLGIGLRGTFRPGPVTLLRLGGRALEEHWVTDAEIVATGDAPDLCRTQVTLAADSGALQSLLDAPLGNHLVLVPGHHAARLERWWRLLHG